jgi:hypothetical protein
LQATEAALTHKSIAIHKAFVYLLFGCLLPVSCSPAGPSRQHQQQQKANNETIMNM